MSAGPVSVSGARTKSARAGADLRGLAPQASPQRGTRRESPFVELFDCVAPDADRLGGKGASLCRLVANGNLVPPGFIVTVDAFERVCEALDLASGIARLGELLSGSADLSDAGGEARERLETGRVPTDVLDPITEVVGRLGLWSEEGARVIVRSSATVEDSAAHSFAGIFESVPISTPAELEPTLRAIWASVFSPRALSYYREIGLAAIPTMALVVQRFIAAERSGVMFTTFRGRTLVEHVEGDCEKLVKGEVTPEQLWLSGRDRQPETVGSLAADHVRELARLAETLEARFNGPQDVEWVLFDNRIHVVQSRPITTSASPDGSSPATPSGVLGAVAILTGTGASSGWGSGKVHLAFNIEDALALSSGDVLVTPMTNPDMVVAMRKSAAIVTDVGGMICHAAIVSRELGLPCVVGTAHATTLLRSGDVVTVSGTDGAVYRGSFDSARKDEVRRDASWSDLWSRWSSGTASRPELVPIIPTIEALDAAPKGCATVVLVPDIDLRSDPTGLWADIEAMPRVEAVALVDHYLMRVADAARRKSIGRVYICPPEALPHDLILERVNILRLDRLRFLGDTATDPAAPALALYSSNVSAAGSVAVPLTGISDGPAMGPVRSSVSGMEEARAAAFDTIKFFGHEPGSHRSTMPRPEFRRGWWELLPEYGRFHQEHATASESGEFTWLEVRPELVISPLLKSLVQPGFEMVPRVMGFAGLPPMHIKWMRCRYHFRSDTFAVVWRSIVRATWDQVYMADLMRRVRASYENLAAVLVLFPTTNLERADLSPQQIEALITSWWPRWVEFFALCWFIQAQGDDVLYPFIEETVKDNLRRLGESPAGFEWPGTQDLVAPTTPVLSGEYMADVMKLRETLLAAGMDTPEKAITAVEGGDSVLVNGRVAEHLSKWRWMRDRDLYFEPWDTPARVVRAALETSAHSAPPYESNHRRQMLALGVHYDLAHSSGRAGGLHHAVRFLHDLNVERENHHVLWLKYSYPLRQLVLEVERRLVALGSLRSGDIFFMQAPELIFAIRSLPAPLSPELVRKVRNRRAAFLDEARLESAVGTELVREDDYY